VSVAALAAVNAFGDVIDPASGEIIAGARTPVEALGKAEAGFFVDTLKVMQAMTGRKNLRFGARQNTVIGVAAPNAALTKEQANKVAQMAHDGLARAIRPAHTMVDGDTIFALSTGQRKADLSTLGAFAAEAFTQAVLRGVRQAWALAGLPAAADVALQHKSQR